MVSLFDIWEMLAGVAIFLLGASFMEEALSFLAGRKFKLFLKKQTSNKLKAIAGGTVVTALLQSSSVVNLLVLSLVGASVIQMQNALAVMLGANLGTTLSNWMVATVGFQFNIESFAFPIAGIAGISLAFFSKSNPWYHWGKFLFGLSFLFIGLGFIKSGMQEVVKNTDLTQFNQYPVLVFFMIGILLTTIVQSSSATMALTLSALYVNAITLYTATAIILGSEIGTTFKLFLASAKGQAVKKRVALGNFLFNAITAIVFLLLLRPLNLFITDIIQIRDNLVALVFFQSVVNIGCIVIFYPFLNVLGRFLEKRFVAGDEGGLFISKVTVSDIELAIDALEKETRYFIFHILDFSNDAFGGKKIVLQQHLQNNFDNKPVNEKYEYIKRLHGEIHGFYIQLQNVSTSEKDTERLDQLIASVRNCMYAAKSIKDALHDVTQLRNSSNDTKYNFYLETRDQMTMFCEKIARLIEVPGKSLSDKLTGVFQSVRQGYTQSLQNLYKKGMTTDLSELEISTLINYNREMYTAFKSIVFAVKDYLLPPNESDHFENTPGFIR